MGTERHGPLQGSSNQSGGLPAERRNRAGREVRPLEQEREAQAVCSVHDFSGSVVLEANHWVCETCTLSHEVLDEHGWLTCKALRESIPEH